MPAFSQSRDIFVLAPAADVHAIIDDFHRWTEWSPWEDVDPDLQRSYTGPERGVGAHYAWEGNKRAGKGSMQITASEPDRIEIDLHFLAPFEARNVTVFTLAPSGVKGTRVTWTMSGHRNVVLSVLGKLFFDKAIAKDFDRGLARLKAIVEA
ncbi:SRPBCC family protein [Nocardioides sp. BGMRC 2183]|nr:SRPBCC family protein [Nocardioides sp. BGMRC 2183]